MYQTVTYSEMNVTGSVASLTVPKHVDRMLLQVVSGSIRIRADGNQPAQSMGLWMGVGGVMEIEGQSDIENVRIVKDAQSPAAVIGVHYEVKS